MQTLMVHLFYINTHVYMIKCVPWQPLSTSTSFVGKNRAKRGHNVSPLLKKNSSLVDGSDSRQDRSLKLKVCKKWTRLIVNLLDTREHLYLAKNNDSRSKGFILDHSCFFPHGRTLSVSGKHPEPDLHSTNKNMARSHALLWMTSPLVLRLLCSSTCFSSSVIGSFERLQNLCGKELTASTSG